MKCCVLLGTFGGQPFELVFLSVDVLFKLLFFCVLTSCAFDRIIRVDFINIEIAL